MTQGSNTIRVLPIEGAYNVRDLGGYCAAGNKTVKWKTVFRSGDLNNLTEKDLEYFSTIPVKTFIDFRDSSEIQEAPDRIPASLIHQISIPIETGNVIDFQKITPESTPTLLIEGNRYLVSHNQEQYRCFFQILMDSGNAPLLFHCSAGKDRAGFGAALFLSSLGVDRETIIQDYLFTNDCLRDKYAALVESIPFIAPLMEARREYIQAAFDEIDTEYAGMTHFLTRNLNVDIDKMRALYTE